MELNAVCSCAVIRIGTSREQAVLLLLLLLLLQ